MSLTTKVSAWVVAALAAILLSGCQGGADGHGVVKDPDVVPQKPLEELTPEEQVERINRLPIPDEEKQKMLSELNSKK